MRRFVYISVTQQANNFSGETLKKNVIVDVRIYGCTSEHMCGLNGHKPDGVFKGKFKV